MTATATEHRHRAPTVRTAVPGTTFLGERPDAGSLCHCDQREHRVIWRPLVERKSAPPELHPGESGGVGGRTKNKLVDPTGQCMTCDQAPGVLAAHRPAKPGPVAQPGPKAHGTRVLMSHSLGRYDVYFKSVANWPTRPFIFRFRNWVAEWL